MPGSGRCVAIPRTCTLFNVDGRALCHLVHGNAVPDIGTKRERALLSGRRLVGLCPLQGGALAGPGPVTGLCDLRPGSYCAVNRVARGFLIGRDAICLRVHGCSVPAERVNGFICMPGGRVSGLCGNIGQ